MQRAVTDRIATAADVRAELIAGLRAERAAIAPKHFYDPVGCALYAAICATPEYYPTRTEAAIFAGHAADIVARVGAGRTLVDLGAGDARKAQWWIPRLRPAAYVGVDYAAAELAAALERLDGAFPDLPLSGVVTDFGRGLDLRADLPPGDVAFFYPGSSIGNFAPDDALVLLRSLRAHAAPERRASLLIGVDTHKDARRLVAAYDDALGITAAFNRNVLNNVNALLGTAFDPAAFRHVALYDESLRRIEMHLEAAREHVVLLDGTPRRFAPGERIHTENSYKYAPQDFARLLRRAGFATATWWTDAAGDFAVFHAA